MTVLPDDHKARKDTPIGTGVLDYFGAALAEVARVSKMGNDQHNPGQPLHWAWGKSNDHWDCIIRHGLDRGTLDTDGQRHTAKVAWRALAMLAEELAAETGVLPRAARLPMPAPRPEDFEVMMAASIPCAMDLGQIRLPLEGGGFATPRRIS